MDLAQRDQNPIEIRGIGIMLTNEVGADDALAVVRVVPDGREGRTVYARTLHPDEPDCGTPVVVNPSAGEQLQFRPGSVVVSIRDVDRSGTADSRGYVPITNTIWTWLSIGATTRPELFRYLLAVARRLDGTNELLTLVSGVLKDVSGGFIGRRTQIFRAISVAETLTVALGRSIDMLSGLRKHFSVAQPLPALIEAKRGAIREIRNAFEHIEDRALGQVNGKPHPDALTVFDQSDFLERGVLRYGPNNLDLQTELPQVLLQARQYIYDVAAEVAGPARQVSSDLSFFKG